MSDLADLSSMPLVMTLEEAGPYLRMTGSGLRKALAAGRMTQITVKVGRSQRVSRYLLEKWLRGELEAA